MSDTVQQIKDRLSIVDVLSSYVKLQKAGANFKALCPFHSEKTPSFHISPARNAYYCFGCGEKGDIFSFVERIEGLDFKGALALLAERAGVPLVYERRESKDARERLYEALAASASFFEGNLTDAARAYLAGRGLLAESMTAWRIGYAKDDWRTLLTHLRAQGFSDAEIERAGLVKRAEGGKEPYDRFRSRIMFPLSDSAGRVVAFSGRIFPNDADAAKYLNSPETELFVKSRILYGFDKAKGHIRKADFSILVEGQMDVVMAHQAGFRNAIALSGTALSEEHLVMLGRLSKRMVIALDADAAGIQSAGKGARAALRAGFDVKVASLPAGLDPADCIVKDPELFRKAIREARHVIDFYLEVLARRTPDERKLRLEVERLVLPYVADIRSAIDQAHFVSRIARTLRLAEEPVASAVRALAQESAQQTPVARTAENRPSISATASADRRALLIERLVSLLLWQEGLAERTIDTEALSSELKAILADEYERARAASASDDERSLFAAEEYFGAAPNLSAMRDELLSGLREEDLKRELSGLSARLRDAESAGDEKLVAELSAKHRERSRALIELRKTNVSL